VRDAQIARLEIENQELKSLLLDRSDEVSRLEEQLARAKNCGCAQYSPTSPKYTPAHSYALTSVYGPHSPGCSSYSPTSPSHNPTSASGRYSPTDQSYDPLGAEKRNGSYSPICPYDSTSDEDN
jgi:hypothetical protein